MDLIRIKSNAKINLGLEIVNKRPDGYHNIRSLFQEIDLCDSIEIKKNNHKRISITCSDSSLPTNQENTVYQAAAFLLDQISGVDIFIEKNIPHQAGLGGGSSNAAATLNGVNQLFNLGLHKSELIKYAEQIGSDVPFFLSGKQALISGTGHIIENVQFQFDYYIVLIKPNISFSTVDIYQNYAIYLDSPEQVQFTKFLSQANSSAFQLLENQLEKAIDNPIIESLKKYLYQQGAFYSAMSGSGSVVYGLFQKEIELTQIPDAIQVYYCKAVT